MLNLINYVKSFANQEEGQDLLDTRCSWRSSR